ncbi:hypothetical protein GGU10DRAFT_371653 [Lentinula aff. detonsa]|uniref:YABBY protein C-terminal domain-containing protein n=1 Tax=Lentinula aff. detonsa TaxID=2804958 RepID=A0AA38NRV6_9AGAR|nr:hypothetical protein GGU10DRAFT_371653 [Lentinula aff. detonsa]
MAPRTSTSGASEKPAKKSKQHVSLDHDLRLIAGSPAKSRGGGGGKKKLTAFNKFMQTEMARLKEEEPDITHQERFKVATANWKHSSQNPNRAS